MVSSDKVDQLAQALADAFGGEVQDYKNKITTDSNFAYLYKGADVNISLKQTEKGLRVTIGDDGCGLPSGFTIQGDSV